MRDSSCNWQIAIFPRLTSISEPVRGKIGAPIQEARMAGASTSAWMASTVAEQMEGAGVTSKLSSSKQRWPPALI